VAESRDTSAKGDAFFYTALTPGEWNNPKRYHAYANGFALGRIESPGSATKGCVCWGYGRTQDITVCATGGNMGYFGPSWAYYMTSNLHSFLLPVAGGDDFYIGVEQNRGHGQQTNAPYFFHWISFEGGNALQSSRSDDAPEPDFVPPPRPVDQLQNRREFIAILEEILGTPIDADTGRQLLELGPLI
jgi:hypothetical protein